MKAFALCTLVLLPTLLSSPVSANGDRPVSRDTTPVVVTSRLPLAPLDSAAFATLAPEALDTPVSGRIPNYLRALASTHPTAVVPFAHLLKSVVYGGTVAPETKLAMGLWIARANGSPYLTAHLSRLLDTTPSGKALRTSVESGKGDTTGTGERIALRYATNLTRAVHGVNDAQFAEARSTYNDAQLVELTMTTCFFNYFARLCQGANLPVEDWAREAPNSLPAAKLAPTLGVARVTLASDEEMKAGSVLVNPSPDLKKGLGIGIANSQRAMLRVPDIAQAWWDYWKAIRDTAVVPREMQLQVSFAVSMANGCRYCTLHQVAGLRRLNVDVAKLQAMQKDDSALTPTEKAAVTFARKLTKAPQAVTDADFATLKTAFPEDKAAMEIILQTCAFNFMNRFTDGLRLPSEEEAVKVYHEVYGDGAYKAYPMQ